MSGEFERIDADVPVSIHDVLGFMTTRLNDFYARLISNLPSRGTTRVPFMGVAFENGHHLLLYNDTWVQKKLQEGSQGFAELLATVAHEALHVILCHIARQMRLYRTYTDPKEQQRFVQRSNAALDTAVNDMARKELDCLGEPVYTHFSTNPKEWCLPEHWGFPAGMVYEWYLSLMMDRDACPECTLKAFKLLKASTGGADDSDDDSAGSEQNGDGGCTHGHTRPKDEPQQGNHKGAHAVWAEMAADMTDDELDIAATLAEQDAYEKLKHTVEEHKKSRGTVPGFVEEVLENLMRPPRIPWTRLLHQWVQARRLSKPKRSLARPRKRWANIPTTMYPGFFRDRTFRLVFAIDTSGSMSSAALSDGLVELQGILRIDRDVEVVVLQFDTKIHEEFVLQAHEPVKVTVKGRGGTDFNAAFQRASEMAKRGEADALIVYTDGFAPAPALTSRPNMPVLWCLIDSGQHPCVGYGHEIRRPR